MNNGFVCRICELEVDICKVCGRKIKDEEKFTCHGKYHTHSRCKLKP